MSRRISIVCGMCGVAVWGCASSERTPASPASTSASHAQHEHAQHPQHPGHHGGEMHHRFENAEQWAKVFDDPARDDWQQPARVIAALELTPSMVVADVGAGTGYFAVRLARAVPNGRVIATDIEPDMIRHIKERAAREGLSNVEPIVTPPDDPKLVNVDRILVVDVWHHLGDRVAYAKRLAGALRPGGRIAVVDFKLDATMGPPKELRLEPEVVAADLRAAGMSTEVSTVDLPQQYIVIARR